MTRLFEAIPLDGTLIIVDGELFQHCFMRPAGADKVHTNCVRREALWAETANCC